MKTRQIVVIACATTIVGMAAAAWSGVRLNTTPSMPVGLWMVTARSMSRDAFVIACLSGPEATEAEDRGYLGLGSCPGRVEPVVKPVAAVAGDVVTVTPKGISVNGLALSRTCAARKRRLGPIAASRSGGYVSSCARHCLAPLGPRSAQLR